MMEELIAMITKHLKKRERVKIAGLGILQVRNCAARMGRNPATGEVNPDQGQQKGCLPRHQRTQNRCRCRTRATVIAQPKSLMRRQKLPQAKRHALFLRSFRF